MKSLGSEKIRWLDLRRGQGRRCGASARVLPQPDRGQSGPGPMAGADRGRQGQGAAAADRHCLSGIW